MYLTLFFTIHGIVVSAIYPIIILFCFVIVSAEELQSLYSRFKVLDLDGDDQITLEGRIDFPDSFFTDVVNDSQYQIL
jgi:hypothetical protein